MDGWCYNQESKGTGVVVLTNTSWDGEALRLPHPILWRGWSYRHRSTGAGAEAWGAGHWQHAMLGNYGGVLGPVGSTNHQGERCLRAVAPKGSAVAPFCHLCAKPHRAVPLQRPAEARCRRPCAACSCLPHGPHRWATCTTITGPQMWWSLLGAAQHCLGTHARSSAGCAQRTSGLSLPAGSTQMVPAVHSSGLVSFA